MNNPEAAIFDDVTPLRSRILCSLRNKQDNENKKVYKFVWTKDGRIYARTEEESQRRNSSGELDQPKPHIINKPQDLAKLGWTLREINDIIHNIRNA